MACGVISCDEKGITPEQYFRKAIRMADDGCPALSLAAVAGDCTPFFDCSPGEGPGPEMTWKQLFFALTGNNQNGCPSLNTIVSGANCNLQNLVAGQLHCSSDYLAVFDPFGDMSYTSFFYEYEWSTDGGASWTLFGGNTHEQLVSTLPNWDTVSYIFRITIRCNQADTYKRVILSTNLDGFPFKNFIQVKVNGTLQLLKMSSLGVNYFCPTDTLEFIQPNTDFSLDVAGPATWNTASQIFTPGTLPSGTYDATFTDVSGGIGNGCTGSKQFIVEIISAPTITGTDTVCSGSSSVLDAGAGYDNYLWSTGATTQTITANTSGTYWVRASKNSLSSCMLQSPDFVFTVKDPLPALSLDTSDPCVTKSYDPATKTYTFVMVAGSFFILEATPGFDTYDFGIGPDPSNQSLQTGATTSYIIGTLNGCSTDPITFIVQVVENNTTTVDAQVGSGPCEWTITITDPEVIQANVSVDVYGNNSGFIGNFSNTLIIDFVLDPSDTSWSAILNAAPGVTGCYKTFLKIDISCT